MEKLKSHDPGAYRRFAKRQMARWMRRLAKRLLDEAPTKHRHYGHAD